LKFTRTYTVRFTHAEAVEVVRAADRLGITVSAYLRRAAVSHAGWVRRQQALRLPVAVRDQPGATALGRAIGDRPVTTFPTTPATESVTLADGAAEQALVPGVPPVDPTTRELAGLEASRHARRRHGALPAGGLFDEAARAQLDLF
jgi:hypothetical protein